MILEIIRNVLYFAGLFTVFIIIMQIIQGEE